MKDFIQERLEYWQKRLRLQDWIVTVKVVRPWDLAEGKCGSVTPTLERKEAVIRVLSADDRHPEDTHTTIETTLVHELLHLLFEPFWNDDKQVEQEQAIEMISRALVAEPETIK